MIIQKPKGTLDILPKIAFKRQYLEKVIRNVFSLYNYKEVKTPTFEKTELFKRSIGEETDIVSKEMYSFENDKYTLKPEMTAPVVRAYLENSLYNISPLQKLFYIDRMYRHENPQAGRYREFTQFGAEAIGSESYTIDVEMITLGIHILNEFSLKNVKVKINNIGDLSERVQFIDSFRKFLENYRNKLSKDSIKRIDTNPLRILDSKIPEDIEILDKAPVLFNYLTEDSKSHFKKVQDGLKNNGIDFLIDHKLVRGLDYYSSTTFEIISEDLGAQNAIFGGGRYDKLIENLGGKPTPAIGFAAGLERLIMVLEKSNFPFPDEKPVDIYIVLAGENVIEFVSSFMYSLRNAGLSCESDFLQRSVKSQMKEADKLKAEFVIVIGENEISSQKAKLKNMKSGDETEIILNDILTIKKTILK
jgi:histidyl-tRNA synthetase